MANINNILQSVLKVAQVLTPVLPQLGAASAIATALSELISNATSAAGSSNPATVAELTKLQEEVNKHARRVFDKLGGGPPPPGGGG
jgi:anti-sigma regulatory factor (Ser/Thr protein kinase)